MGAQAGPGPLAPRQLNEGDNANAEARNGTIERDPGLRMKQRCSSSGPSVRPQEPAFHAGVRVAVNTDVASGTANVVHGAAQIAGHASDAETAGGAVQRAANLTAHNASQAGDTAHRSAQVANVTGHAASQSRRHHPPCHPGRQ